MMSVGDVSLLTTLDRLVVTETSDRVMAFPELPVGLHPAGALRPRQVSPRRRADPAERDHTARDQPALYRGVHDRHEPRDEPRVALARVPDRPSRQPAAALLGLVRRPARYRAAAYLADGECAGTQHAAARVDRSCCSCEATFCAVTRTPSCSPGVPPAAISRSARCGRHRPTDIRRPVRSGRDLLRLPLTDDDLEADWFFVLQEQPTEPRFGSTKALRPSPAAPGPMPPGPIAEQPRENTSCSPATPVQHHPQRRHLRHQRRSPVPSRCNDLSASRCAAASCSSPTSNRVMPQPGIDIAAHLPSRRRLDATDARLRKTEARLSDARAEHARLAAAGGAAGRLDAAEERVRALLADHAELADGRDALLDELHDLSGVRSEAVIRPVRRDPRRSRSDLHVARAPRDPVLHAAAAAPYPDLP